MWQSIKDNLTWFIGGALSGIVAGVELLSNVYVGFILKCGAAFIIAIITGLATALGKNIYDHKIKPKLFKNGHKKDNGSKAA